MYVCMWCLEKVTANTVFQKKKTFKEKKVVGREGRGKFIITNCTQKQLN